MKYMGSKNRISKDILHIILENRKEDQWYVEPFVGGCNVIDKVDGNRIGSDNNEYLIQLLKSLQNGYVPIDFISRDDYYDIKYNMNKYPMEVVALCGILASYNGNWFRAYGGYSKTKSGKDRNYYAEGVRGLLKQVPNIKNVIFNYSDYKNLQIPNNSIIYCDPPYLDVYKTYKDKKFDHNEFWQWCRDRKSEGHTIFISEKTAPEDFKCVWEKEMQVTHARQKIKHIEKLFTI